MFNRRQEFIRLQWAVADAVVTTVALESAYILRQHLSAFRLFFLDRATMVGLLATSVTVWVAAGAAVGLYRLPPSTHIIVIARVIFRQTVWSAAAITCWLYLLQLGSVSRFFIALFVAINAALLLGWRVFAPALGRVTRETASKRSYVIVGTGDDAVRVVRLIEADGTAEVVAHIRTEDADAGRGNPALSEFKQLLKKKTIVDEVIFAVPRDKADGLEDLFRTCHEEGVKFRVVVNFLPQTAAEVTLDHLYDLPLLTFCTAPDNDYLLFLKRLFDVVIACCMLAAFAPVGLVVMAAIRLSSRGPVFFVQQRCGLNGRPFRLYKFRSMYEGADGRLTEIAHLNEMDGPVFKCAADPRITPIGRILRKFSIDEWPQLFNVILGDMSLVGPRPPLPKEVEQYEPWQRRRLRMRPGLTCLWVLEGRNKLNFRNWMRLDLQYIDHWSLALDWKILLQSIPHVLSGKGM